MRNVVQADLDKLETCFSECDEDLASCSKESSCERRESRARRTEEERTEAFFLCERRPRRRIRRAMREQF
jgi:hypothetical protein